MSMQDREDQNKYGAAGAPYNPAYDPGTGPAYRAEDAVPPPPPPPYPGYGPGVPHPPNPLLAGLLGFIPGVGAMYNGQFAKGLVHIGVFAIFTSLANNISGLFGLLVAGWVFYMAFEAYQTAMARRAGAPLPDPFGLNNIGERFGFHSSHHPDLNNAWSQTVGKMPGAAPGMEDARYDPSAGPSPYSAGPGSYQGAYQVDPAGNVYTPPPPGVPPVPPVSAPYGTTYDPSGYPGPAYGVPPVPPPPPGYSMPPVPGSMPPMPPMPPMPRSGLPSGAVWLIGLGVFALLGSLHPFRFLEGEATGGLFLIGLALFLGFRRRQQMASLYPPGSPVAAPLANLSFYRGAGVLFVVGLLTLLQGLRIVYWHQSWPFLLIFLGILMVAERVTQNRVAASQFGAYPGYTQPQTGAPPAPVEDKDAPVSIVPRYTRPDGESTDLSGREGR